MSPLIGSIGGSSNYAYRGTLDNYSDEFFFTNVSNAEPGQTYNSNIVTISGINNAIRVSVGSGVSYSVNGGAFSTTPSFLRNGDTLQISYTTVKNNTSSDFSNEQSVLVTVGNRTPYWSISVRAQDTAPNPITFQNLTNVSLGIAQTSNQVTVSGLEPGYNIPISITGVGSVSINGNTPIASGTVVNGDVLYLQHPILVNSLQENYGLSRTSNVSIGSSVFLWTTTTEQADLTPDPLVFSSVINAELNTDVISNSVTISGVNSLTTPRFEIPISVTGQNAFYDINGSGSFINSSRTVVSGDKVRARIRSSSTPNTIQIASLDVGGVIGSFSVKSAFANTIPNAFTFTNVTSALVNTNYDSNNIILSGITTGFFGTASINAGSFRVVRGGSVIRDFSSSSFQVTQGDQITLRLTSSSNYSSSVSSTFTVSGTNSTGGSGSRSAIWTITTFNPSPTGSPSPTPIIRSEPVPLPLLPTPPIVAPPVPTPLLPTPPTPILPKPPPTPIVLK